MGYTLYSVTGVVAELVDALSSGGSNASCAGSIPVYITRDDIS